MIVKTLQLESRRWFRSGKFQILLIAFMFVAVLSPIFAYNANHILKTLMAGENVKLILASKVSPEILMQSYFKNSSQIVLFIVAYVVSMMVGLPKNKSARLFFISRTHKGYKLYLIKIIVALLLLIMISLIAGLICLYINGSYFSNIHFKNYFISILVQIIGISTITMLAILMSIVFKSSFVSAVIIEIVIVISSTLREFNWFKNWSITELLMPIDVLTKGWNQTVNQLSIIALCVLVSSMFLVCVIPAYRRL